MIMNKLITKALKLVPAKSLLNVSGPIKPN